MSKNYNQTLQTNNSSLEEIITQLNNMPDAGEGLDTSDATATSGDILSGKTAYVDGEKVTGTIATKTASNLTASGATITVPAGHYATQVTKSVATATQATPSITVSSAGLITASSTQSAGYVAAGTKSGTKQLTTQAAKTITPTTSNQTAIASGVYTTGAVTVAAIPNNYEDVADETSAYTTKISELETAVATLETELEGKASGGSSGESIKTCTVTITFSGSSFYSYSATVYTDNLVQPCYSITSGQSVTIENVICDSSICILAANNIFYEAAGMTFISTSGGLEYIGCNNYTYNMGILKAPSVANSTGVFSLTYD